MRSAVGALAALAASATDQTNLDDIAGFNLASDHIVITGHAARTSANVTSYTDAAANSSEADAFAFAFAYRYAFGDRTTHRTATRARPTTWLCRRATAAPPPSTCSPPTTRRSPSPASPLRFSRREPLLKADRRPRRLSIFAPAEVLSRFRQRLTSTHGCRAAEDQNAPLMDDTTKFATVRRSQGGETRMRVSAAATLSLVLSSAVSSAPIGAASAQPLQMPKPAMTDPAPEGVRVDQPGVIGNYFRTRQPGRHPGIILLGGSEGGLGPGALHQAKLLGQEGFDVLQLAYFGVPGEPATLANVPVETFSRGLAWLRARPEVEAAKIGLVGSSKGAEAALLFASRDPNVKVVVVGMPTSVVWPGITYTPDPQSSWTSNGQPVVFLPYFVGTPFSIYNAYAEGLASLPQHPAAAIEVEHLNGPILLICGKADTLWPSCPMSKQIVARLKARGFKHEVELLAYKDAGHALFGPPVPPSSPAYPSLDSLGGSPAGNDAARQDDWPKSIAFLHAALGF